MKLNSPVRQSSSAVAKAPVAPAPAPSKPILQVLSTDTEWVPNDTPLRRLGFYFALGFVFFRVSHLHELLIMEIGVNTYIFLLIRLMAISAALLSGGLARTFNSRGGFCWLLFVVWMGLGAPLSTWRADSIAGFIGYIQGSLPVLFVVAGLAYSVRDCVRLLYATAFGGIVNIMAGRLFMNMLNNPGDSRLSGLGSIGNSNDYAAQLLLVLPFVVFLLLVAKDKMLKIGALCALPFGFYYAASSASRGALVAAAAGLLFVLAKAPGRIRLGMIATVPLVLAVIVVRLPDSAISRYKTIWTSSGDLPEEAVESAETRRYLLTSSIEMTLRHPLFGVGLGQFSNVLGGNAAAEGKRSVWQVTHNAYTQVSSETGIPGLLFFLAAIVTTFHLLNSTFKRCRAHPALKKIETGTFCMMLSLICFCVAIFFLSLAYEWHLLLLTGLAVVIDRAVRRELKSAEEKQLQAGALAS
jgi:O-antigen ligase